METRAPDSLYFPRVIWFATQEQSKEQTEVFLNLVKDHTYSYNGIEVVVNIHNVLNLQSTKSVHEYFEYLKSYASQIIKTLCVIGFASQDLTKRDILLSKVTKLLTPFRTAYVNVPDGVINNQAEMRTFNYLIGKDKTALKLSNIIHYGT